MLYEDKKTTEKDGSTNFSCMQDISQLIRGW